MRWRRDGDEGEPEVQAPSDATPEHAPAGESDAGPSPDEPEPEPAEASADGRPARDPDADLGVIDPTELGRATRRAVARALAEDLGDRGDVTSIAVVPAGTQGTAAIVARQDGAVFGLDVLLHVFEQLDTRVDVELHVEDGELVTAGQPVATLRGPTRSILTGERVALNFLGHLSGICTQVRRYVQAAGGVVLRDTRKTTPGLRLLEKAAVRAGGGHSHRIGLHDAILVKDNHVAAAGGIAAAVRSAQDRGRGRHVQVEVRTLSELEEALAAGAADVLLDNFDPDEVRTAVDRTAGRAVLEASGTIDLDNLAAYADTGVDRIAVGRLTHSAPWLDIALDVVETVRPEASFPLTSEPAPAPEPEPQPDPGPQPEPEPEPRDARSVIDELAEAAPVEDGVADDAGHDEIADEAGEDDVEDGGTDDDDAGVDEADDDAGVDETEDAEAGAGEASEDRLFDWRDGPPAPGG